LREARRRRAGLPPACAGQVSSLIESAQRFARPDGSPATDFSDGAMLGARRNALRSGALTAWSSAVRPLASLHDDGAATGDFLAVDHRDHTAACRLEIFGAGRSWLGPAWSACPESAAITRPNVLPWISTAKADLVEWTYRSAGARITQSALLLRGRMLALLGVLAEFGVSPPPSAQVRVSRPLAIEAHPIAKTRAVLLTAPNKRASAQVLPVGLPCLSYPTERGAFTVERDEVVLTLACTGRRVWLPLLVSWDMKRHRMDPHWRVLTVSERSRAVAPDRAFAVRVSWSKAETYVIYRSLAAPAARAFLGHHTKARFLVGRFTKDGDVDPILAVD
jgi:hypothetical protein